MRNIGFLFNQQIFPKRGKKEAPSPPPIPKQPLFQQYNQLLITQPPQQTPRETEHIPFLAEFTLENEELRKLEINLELNKFTYNRDRFIHTNIPTQVEEKKVLVIPEGMFHKAEEIDPEFKPRRRPMNRLIAKQVLMEVGSYYTEDINKSFSYKFKRSPSVIIRKEPRNNSPKPRLESPAGSPVSANKKTVEVERRVYKENIRHEPPPKKNLSIKIVEGFEEGHARFTTLMQCAVKLIGKSKG